ncbi:glycosyltransferase family 2 protein [Arthrobacter globiformis]|uniref:glycosyltransferase family 2 protein n=1 Tax=Arthrobacter globiformis TaxID=1665 RepID=UPI0015521854|nr:glycosyltransferase [Arthrobacter globiformis]
MKFHVILATHNRRDTSVRSVSSLVSACRQAQAEITVTVFDDGSTDATVESLLEVFPALEVIPGDGSNFWAKSMHLAEAHVFSALSSKDGPEDEFIVWLNDDVVLDIDAFIRAADIASLHEDSVIAFAMRDPETLHPTYSGFRRPGLHPLRLVQVKPESYVQEIDTINGNLVFVPLRIAQRLGSIDGRYAHALADIDYGFRAKQAGIRVILAPGTYGTCPRNPVPCRQSLRSDWKSFIGVKGGGHPRSLLRMLRLGAPRLWPLFFGCTYFLWWLRALLRVLKR